MSAKSPSVDEVFADKQILFPEKVYCCFHPILKTHLWFPAENALGLAIVEVGQVDVAGAFGRMSDFWFVVGDVCQDVINLVDGDGVASTDTENFVVAMFDGK